ncbi:MAG: hypothetical protein U0935_16575 [Pirellulales bacterium]
MAIALAVAGACHYVGAAPESQPAVAAPPAATAENSARPARSGIPLGASDLPFWLWAAGALGVLGGAAWHGDRQFWRRSHRIPSARRFVPTVLLLAPMGICLVMAILCLIGSRLDGHATSSMLPREWRLVWSGGLVLITVLLSLGWGRQRARRVTANREVCPSCLGAGDLHDAPEPPPDWLLCRHLVRRWQEEECGFTFPRRWADFPRLRFPVLGVAAAGKTLWLATLYRQLRHLIAPPQLQFDCLVSPEPWWDHFLDTLLRHPQANVPEVPDPSVHFAVRDDDRWGRASALVSLVDLSGDRGFEPLTASRRQAAEFGAGHLLLLDATQPAERQCELVAALLQDLLCQRACPAGRPLSSPIAVVISKLDLLAQQTCLAAATDEAQRLFDDLQHLDATAPRWSLTAILQRSAALHQILPLLWPGWRLARMIEANFGHPCVLFPLSSIGLHGAGQPDFSQRLIDPYGVLEPVLWLLHMNGYQVFPDA